jgi:D-alanyl-D-alanine carboxypeptidase (penicillin-binding protein 5/6)
MRLGGSRPLRAGRTAVVLAAVVLMVASCTGGSGSPGKHIASRSVGNHSSRGAGSRPSVGLIVDPGGGPVDAPHLAWPGAEPAAIGIAGVGIIDGPADHPVPIASVTKLMTAYLILAHHPLSPGQQGPTILVSQGDYLAYLQYASQNASSVKVTPGEHVSEYQLLEALLVSSAANAADMLANWDAGDLGTFVAEMNATARSLGMTHTSYSDASGLSPLDSSTAYDQTLLAMQLMSNPVVRQIVRQKSVVDFPGVPRLPSYNPILGQDGVDGVKSGFTSEAGASLVFSSEQQVGEVSYTVVGAVLGHKGPAALKTVGQECLGLMRSFLGSVSAGLPGSGQKVGLVLRYRHRSLHGTAAIPGAIYFPGLQIAASLVDLPKANGEGGRIARGPARAVVQVRVGWQVFRDEVYFS